eukprot:5241548-Ditylum_brightwellii.AAC.2
MLQIIPKQAQPQWDIWTEDISTARSAGKSPVSELTEVEMWAGPESGDIDNIDGYNNLLDEDPDIIKLQYKSLGIQTVKGTEMNPSFDAKSIKENIFDSNSPMNTNTASFHQLLQG